MKSIKCIILMGSFFIFSLITYANEKIYIELDDVAIREDTWYQSLVIGKLSKGDIVAIKPIQDPIWYYLENGGVVRKNYATRVEDRGNNANPIYGTLEENIWVEKEDNTLLAILKGDKVVIEEALESTYRVRFYDQLAYVPKESVSLKEAQPLAKEVTSYALQFVGNSYQLGGNSLVSGTDCSGFVKLVYEQFDIEIQRNAALQYEMDGDFIPLEDLQEGDLVFYGQDNISHVALYIGEQQIVHASTPQSGICISPLILEEPIKGIKRMF